MGDKYLSDVIDYERDMKGHNFIAIYSGVGSGKNRFIESFCKKDPDIDNPQMTVLVITSRRAKVDEILESQNPKNDEDLDEKILGAKDINVYIQSKIGRWGNVHRVKSENETKEEFKEKNSKYLRVIEDGYWSYVVVDYLK